MIEEYAKDLFAEAQFDRRAALTLLRKRLISHAALGSSPLPEAIDQALLTAIAIDREAASYSQQQAVEQAAREFRNRFSEFLHNGEETHGGSKEPGTAPTG